MAHLGCLRAPASSICTLTLLLERRGDGVQIGARLGFQQGDAAAALLEAQAVTAGQRAGLVVIGFHQQVPLAVSCGLATPCSSTSPLRRVCRGALPSALRATRCLLPLSGVR